MALKREIVIIYIIIMVGYVIINNNPARKISALIQYYIKISLFQEEATYTYIKAIEGEECDIGIMNA